MADVVPDGWRILAMEGAWWGSRSMGGRRGHRGQGVGTCTRLGRDGVHHAKHHAAGLDSIKALPDHCDDGAGGHVLGEVREEVGVVYSVHVMQVSWGGAGKGVGGVYAS